MKFHHNYFDHAGVQGCSPPDGLFLLGVVSHHHMSPSCIRKKQLSEALASQQPVPAPFIFILFSLFPEASIDIVTYHYHKGGGKSQMLSGRATWEPFHCLKATVGVSEQAGGQGRGRRRWNCDGNRHNYL